MGKLIADVQPFQDSLSALNSGLANHMTGLGTAKDKATQGAWGFSEPDAYQLENAYRSNWMARKVVDIPAMDMIREGIEWQAEGNQIQALDAEMKRLGVTQKLIQALKWSRLYGGAAIYISDGSENPSEPLDTSRIQRQGVQFLKVFSRYQLSGAEIDMDPASEFEGQPKLYNLQGATSGSVYVHPSRLVRFIGHAIPIAHGYRADVWGDSVLTSIDQTIKDCTAGQQGIATLIQEASVDIYSIDELANKLSTPAHREALLARMALMGQTKSLVNGVVIDTKDKWEQKSASFGALPDVQRLLLQIVSGAADIPATRMLGQAPQGMNATGEGDLINYYDRISADQNVTLRPCLDRLFAALIPSALGAPVELEYVFNSLWQMSAQDKADVDYKNAQTAEIYDRAALVDSFALREGVKAQVLQNDVYPGISGAFNEAELRGPAPDTGTGEELNDGMTAPLYVYRSVKNGQDFIDWANSQGFGKTLTADDLHVTIIYSKTPVVWAEAQAPSVYGSRPELTIESEGERTVAPLGDKGAVVLKFESGDLQWRHADIRERSGASHDFPSFQTHLTITYDGTDLDLSQVTPYEGPIILGPEVFQELDLDWKPG
jgi:phage-related protein (TIGR01555 family)